MFLSQLGNLSIKSLLIVIILGLFADSASAQHKQTLGWVEKVKITPGELVLQAKIDTGADHSSLNASHFEEFERNGKKWVRFEISNRYGKSTVLERQIVGYTKIKRQAKPSQKRMVITLGICIGETYMESEVNLVDRTKFDYHMLIGRSYLAGNFVVDPAITYTISPTCKGAPQL